MTAKKAATKNALSELLSTGGKVFVVLAATPNEQYRLAMLDDILGALWDYDQELRMTLKYETNPELKTANEALEWARAKLFQLFQERGVDWDKLHE